MWGHVTTIEDGGGGPGSVYLYRVEARMNGSFNEDGDLLSRHPYVQVLRFRVKHKTKHGWRLSNGRYVNGSAVKRYARETLREAYGDYLERNKAHQNILTSRLRDLERLREFAEQQIQKIPPPV